VSDWPLAILDLDETLLTYLQTLVGCANFRAIEKRGPLQNSWAGIIAENL
jgi:hypothetical protein